METRKQNRMALRCFGLAGALVCSLGLVLSLASSLKSPYFLQMSLEREFREEKSAAQKSAAQPPAAQPPDTFACPVSFYYMDSKVGDIPWRPDISLSFPQLEGTGIRWEPLQWMDAEPMYPDYSVYLKENERYGLYRISGIFSGKEDAVPEEGILIDCLKATDSSGRTLEYPIGHIRLMKEEPFQAFRATGSSSSSNGQGKYYYEALEDCTITGLETADQKMLEQQFELLIDGQPVCDINMLQFQKGQKLVVSYNWKGETDPDIMLPREFLLKLTGTAEGREGCLLTISLSHSYGLSFRHLRSIPFQAGKEGKL